MSVHADRSQPRFLPPCALDSATRLKFKPSCRNCAAYGRVPKPRAADFPQRESGGQTKTRPYLKRPVQPENSSDDKVDVFRSLLGFRRCIRGIITDMAIEICQSLPFVLGDVDPFDHPQPAQGRIRKDRVAISDIFVSQSHGIRLVVALSYKNIQLVRVVSPSSSSGISD